MRLGRGFTLVELVTVITVTAILATVVSTILSRPIEGFEDSARRARLVDLAATALERMSRELRLAVPNSVRIDGGASTSCDTGSAGTCSLEFLRTLEGGRYRREADPGPGGDDVLSLTATSDSFEVMGTLSAEAVAYCSSHTCSLVIYNAGPPGGPDAYAGQNIAPITALTAHSVSFTGAPPFPLGSPAQRFQIVDTPVRFHCNAGTGELRRYDGYPIGGAPSGSGALLAEGVRRCRFAYDAGTATRSALVTLEVEVADQGVTGSGSESVFMLAQAHVLNVP